MLRLIFTQLKFLRSVLFIPQSRWKKSLIALTHCQLSVGSLHFYWQIIVNRPLLVSPPFDTHLGQHFIWLNHDHHKIPRIAAAIISRNTLAPTTKAPWISGLNSDSIPIHPLQNHHFHCFNCPGFFVAPTPPWVSGNAGPLRDNQQTGNDDGDDELGPVPPFPRTGSNVGKATNHMRIFFGICHHQYMTLG